MQTFLDDVAKIILTSKHELDRVKIIVPSIRATIFLKEALKKVINKPHIAPEIISIESFLEDLSGLQSISKIDLLYFFYNLYQNETPEKDQDTFSQFFNWAPTLLQEFNEIDAQLVDPKSIFSFMGAVDALEKWQSEGEGYLIKHHIEFQTKVPKYYNELYLELLRNQKAYSGMQLREAVSNLEFYTNSVDIPFHYFVGFNALTLSEQTIIQELIAADKAEILWDIDHDFYSDPFHGAGYFIRNYFSNWKPLKKKSKLNFPAFFSNPKKIEIISAAKNIMQAKTSVQLASSLYSKNPNESTAIVLGDEGLLPPILSALPNEGMTWNVTMGYPLKNTVIVSFFSKLFDSLEGLQKEGFQYNHIKDLTQTAQIGMFLNKSGFDINQLLSSYEHTNMFYIPSQELVNKSKSANLLFKPFEKTSIFLNRMKFFSQIFLEFQNSQNTDWVLVECCKKIISLWESIIESHLEKNYMKTLLDVKMIFELMVQKEQIDFTGDALSGVQIMGVLETRLLDFDNVIITNLNEGILPYGKTPFSWIPFDIRKKFGMNTFIEQDHLYAYHFFRLIQRAKNVFLIYNSIPEGLFSGEKSRFIKHLEYFKSPKHELVYKQADLDLGNPYSTQKEAFKTKAVLKQLDEIGKEGFSPSSLSQYIRNPYLFYEQRMLKIKPQDSPEEHLTALDKGTVIHEVLEELYQPYLIKEMKKEYYDQMLLNLTEKIEITFNKHYKNDVLKTGKNFLIYKVTESVLRNFLVKEKAEIKKGNTLKILSLERKFSIPVLVQKIQKTITIKGTVDRIDQWNGDIRFVDYKTGNVAAKNLTFTNWNEIILHFEKSALFQVLLYAYIFKEEYKNQNVLVGVIPLKSFESQFLPVQVKENSKKKEILMMTESVFKAFENELFELIKEIYNPSISFVNNDKT